jgi:hypothetical protein
VSAANRVYNVDFAIESAKKPINKPDPPKSPSKDLKAKLRLSRGRSRGGTLLCQQAPPQQAKDVSSRENNRDRNPREHPGKADVMYGTNARINGSDVAKQGAPRTKTRLGNQNTTLTSESLIKPAKVDQTVVPPEDPHPSSSSDAFEDMELVYGRMDQRLIPPPIVTKPQQARQSKQQSRKTIYKPGSKPVSKVPNPIPNPTAQNQANPSLDQLPSHSLAKPSNAAPTSENAASSPSIPAAKPGIAQKRKPSALRLQQAPKLPTPAAADPIEDASTPTNPLPTTHSPTRKFRRIRSETDAAIPSQSAEWERKNVTSNPAFKPPNESAGPSGQKPDPRRKFQRTKSLNVGVKRGIYDPDDGAAAVVVPPEPVPDTDVGPWSSEAFDLFDWRPPGREGQRGEAIGKGIGLSADKD